MSNSSNDDDDHDEESLPELRRLECVRLALSMGAGAGGNAAELIKKASEIERYVRDGQPSSEPKDA